MRVQYAYTFIVLFCVALLTHARIFGRFVIRGTIHFPRAAMKLRNQFNYRWHEHDSSSHVECEWHSAFVAELIERDHSREFGFIN